MKRVLLLAGTHEARALAGRLWDMPRLRVIASLAGVTRSPLPISAETRQGGFGGPAGLAAYLRQAQIDALVDATHPFAAKMPWHAAEAAHQVGIPRLRLLRPPWPVLPEWAEVTDLTEALQPLPRGARVLVTTGRRDLLPLQDRPDLRILLRSIEPAGPVPQHVHTIEARPTGPVATEVALMASHRISQLITKNSGGDRAKLDAAATLGVMVTVIKRPPQPPGPTVAKTEDAAAWLNRTLSCGS